MLANQGKFRDRNPDVLPAGKLTCDGDHTSDSMKVSSERVETPTLVKQFRAWTYPEPGDKRIYVGKHLDVASSMTHGVQCRSKENSGNLINPTPLTYFQQKIIDGQERIYDSKQKKPLGRFPDQTDKFAKGISINDTFGELTKRSGAADKVINPRISRQEVEAASIAGTELYRKSHQYSNVGEQKDLDYNWTLIKKTDVFGVETPHNNDGVHVKNSLVWSEDDKNQKTQSLVSKRLDDFKERTQPKLGEVHDPIKTSMNIPKDHTFGVMITPDEYSAGDLLHHREANTYLRAMDRRRGAVAAIRDHLKKANYHNFQDIREAFKTYDKNGSGKIEADDLMEVCKSFHLPVDNYLLKDLVSYCDSDNDNKIDFVDFSNFLNWKYDLPENVKQDAANIDPESLVRQIDGNMGDHQTSSSVVNAVVGQVPTHNFRSFGVPTIRSDLPAPRIKRVGDNTNYGEQSDAYGLLNPSIYSSHGLTEKDFFQSRPKEHIKRIFDKMGMNLSEQDFESIWGRAVANSPESIVSVDSFLHALKNPAA